MQGAESKGKYCWKGEFVPARVQDLLAILEGG